jgi:hypothetical protein
MPGAWLNQAVVGGRVEPKVLRFVPRTLPPSDRLARACGGSSNRNGISADVVRKAVLTFNHEGDYHYRPDIGFESPKPGEALSLTDATQKDLTPWASLFFRVRGSTITAVFRSDTLLDHVAQPFVDTNSTRECIDMSRDGMILHPNSPAATYDC